MVDFVEMTIKRQKRIALIAHDGKKDEIIKWCQTNKDILSKHKLSGTGTTARMIADCVGLEIRGYNSGPLGADASLLGRRQVGGLGLQGVQTELQSGRSGLVGSLFSSFTDQLVKSRH